MRPGQLSKKYLFDGSKTSLQAWVNIVILATVQCILNWAYFSHHSVSFVLIGEYIQYSPLWYSPLIFPSMIFPPNIPLYDIPPDIPLSEQRKPRYVKNQYVILRHLGDMCLFISSLRASVNKSHIPSLPQNNLYLYQPRTQGISSRASKEPRWEIPWYRLVTCLPESGRLQ